MILTLYSIPILVHSFGIFLLLQVKDVADDRPQFWHILALSVTVLTYSVHRLIHGIFEVYQPMNEPIKVPYLLFGQSGLVILFVLLMMVILFDRFFEIYFHLRYPLFYSAEKSRKLIAFVIAFSFVTYIITVLCFKTLQDTRRFLGLYLWPFLSIAFILSSISVYAYIHWKSFHFNRHQSRIAPHESHLNDEPIRQRKIKRRLLLPTILISSFIFSWTLPALIVFISRLKGSPVTGSLNTITYTIVLLGLVGDAIIYVLIYPPIRRYILLQRANYLRFRNIRSNRVSKSSNDRSARFSNTTGVVLN